MSWKVVGLNLCASKGFFSHNLLWCKLPKCDHLVVAFVHYIISNCINCFVNTGGRCIWNSNSGLLEKKNHSPICRCISMIFFYVKSFQRSNASRPNRKKLQIQGKSWTNICNILTPIRSGQITAENCGNLWRWKAEKRPQGWIRKFFFNTFVRCLENNSVTKERICRGHGSSVGRASLQRPLKEMQVRLSWVRILAAS